MFKKEIIRVMKEERRALKKTELTLNYDEVQEVIRAIQWRKGKVFFLGVGKSGHIAEKLAATFSSTGTPSIFIHGTEACHGDLGMVESKDIVILCSNSGTTQEVVQNIKPLKAIGATTIAFTSNGDSELAKGCDYKIVYPKFKEADRNNLAPSTTTTVQLALGDAIALALSKTYHFKKSDFHKFHPNGALGEASKK